MLKLKSCIARKPIFSARRRLDVAEDRVWAVEVIVEGFEAVTH